MLRRALCNDIAVFVYSRSGTRRGQIGGPQVVFDWASAIGYVSRTPDAKHYLGSDIYASVEVYAFM
jgi:hypothetical protein